MDEPRGFGDVLRTLKAAGEVLRNVATVAAEAYATSKWRAKPIVDHHFTVGNDGRYGWAALSPRYAKEKNMGTVAIGRGNGVFLGKLASVLGPESAKQAARAKHKAGERAASRLEIGAGANLPMLVRTGKMRNVITTQARIEATDSWSVRIVWTVEDYVKWTHTGGSKSGRPPKRSPIEPNAEDLAEVRAVVANYVNQAIGAGRTSAKP